MSASENKRDWRWTRAAYVITALLQEQRICAYIPFAHYADLFGMDEDEVEEFFEEVCADLGVRINVFADPTFQ